MQNIKNTKWYYIYNITNIAKDKTLGIKKLDSHHKIYYTGEKFDQCGTHNSWTVLPDVRSKHFIKSTLTTSCFDKYNFQQ